MIRRQLNSVGLALRVTTLLLPFVAFAAAFLVLTVYNDVTAYAAAVVIIGGLVAWVLLDHRMQRRKLADLEARGVARRSEPARPASP